MTPINIWRHMNDIISKSSRLQHNGQIAAINKTITLFLGGSHGNVLKSFTKMRVFSYGDFFSSENKSIVLYL